MDGPYHTRGVAPRARWRYLFPIKRYETRKPWPNGQRNALSAAARQGNEIYIAMALNRSLTCEVAVIRIANQKYNKVMV
jgi:hypothetical protein